MHLFLLCWFSSPGRLCLQALGCTLVSELSGACSNWQAAVPFSTVGWTAPSSTFCYSQAPPANCFVKWGKNRWRAECSSWQIPQHCKYDSPCCKQGNAKWRRWLVRKLENRKTHSAAKTPSSSNATRHLAQGWEPQSILCFALKIPVSLWRARANASTTTNHLASADECSATSSSGWRYSESGSHRQALPSELHLPKNEGKERLDKTKNFIAFRL